MNKKLIILADSFQVTGPRQSDGTYTVKFTTGEYEKQNVAKMLEFPHDVVLKVTVEIE